MNMKVFLAGLAAAVVAFLLGWVLYGILLMDFFTANTIQYEGLVKTDMNLLLMFVSNLVFGFFTAWIVSKFEGTITVVRAIGVSVVIGLSIAIGIDLMFLAGYNLINTTNAIVDILCYGVLYAAMGVVIGLILKPKKV